MARKVIWSDEAIADLRDVVTRIARDNRAAAEAMGLAIFERTRILADFPQAGRVVPEERDPSVREIIVEPYRVIYELNECQRADRGCAPRLARRPWSAGIVIIPAHSRLPPWRGRGHSGLSVRVPSPAPG